MLIECVKICAQLMEVVMKYANTPWAIKNNHTIKMALEVLNIWYKDWDLYKNDKFLYNKRYGLVCKTKGIVKHDRVLNGVFHK